MEGAWTVASRHPAASPETGPEASGRDAVGMALDDRSLRCGVGACLPSRLLPFATRACVAPGVPMKLQSRMLSLAVLAALPALAQAADDTTALDQILVTATRTPIALQDSIAPAQVIDRAQIESSQATSLQELLRGRAGINLTNAGGLGKQSSLFLRGTNSGHTVVLVDGVRINSADLGLAMCQDLPLAQIERVEIVRGPQSSLYGADAIGGVIQIFTRRNQGDFAPHFQLGGGSNGLREASGGIGGGTERGWFGADIAYQHSDGIDACRGSATLFTGCFADEHDRDGYRNLSKSLRGGYTFNDQWNVEGSALRADGKNHYDGYYNYSETRQRVLAGKVRYTPSERLAFTANVGRSDNESDNFGDFGARGSAQTHRDSASLQGDFGVAEGQLLSAGVDWSEDNLDGSSAGYLVDSRRNTGVFVQYQGRFGRHQLQASARNDDNQQFSNHATGSSAGRWNWATACASMPATAPRSRHRPSATCTTRGAACRR
jgi:vitamin B12 transporter